MKTTSLSCVALALALVLASCHSQPDLGRWCHDFIDRTAAPRAAIDRLGDEDQVKRDLALEDVKVGFGESGLLLAADVCGSAQGDSPDDALQRHERMTQYWGVLKPALLAASMSHQPVDDADRERIRHAVAQMSWA